VKEVRLAAGPSAGTPAALVEPGKTVPLGDLVEAGKEPGPGTLSIPLDVTFGDGTVERITHELAVPYAFRASLVEGQAQPTVRVAFRVAPRPGLAIEVAGTPVVVQESGEAVYQAEAESLRGKEGIWKEGPERVDLTLPFSLKDAAGVVAEGAAAVSVAIVPLRVDFPGDKTFTTDASLWVRGETAPGAAIVLDGAPVTVNENGTFAVELPLAGDASRTLALSASLGGALARVASVTVQRVTREELQRGADAYAAEITERLGYTDFATATANFQGRRVDLLGRIRSNPVAREGIVSFVLYVDVPSGCPAAQVCAVMVHASTALELGERQQVRVLGEISGREQTTSQEFPELPAVRAVFVVPR
jgi:hypothetical protein